MFRNAKRVVLTLFLSLVLLLLSCGSVYWYLAILPAEVTPFAPLPPKAALLRHTGVSAIHRFSYIDSYSVEASPQKVIAFYKEIATDCYQDAARVSEVPNVQNHLLSCVGSANPIGDYAVRIGYEQGSRVNKTILIVQVFWAVF